MTGVPEFREVAWRACLLAVAHEQFKQMDIKQLRAFGKPDSVIYDLKYLFPAEQTDERL